jgi:hypothetical protein
VPAPIVPRSRSWRASTACCRAGCCRAFAGRRTSTADRNNVSHECLVVASARGREAIQQCGVVWIATTASRSRDDGSMEHELVIPRTSLGDVCSKDTMARSPRARRRASSYYLASRRNRAECGVLGSLVRIIDPIGKAHFGAAFGLAPPFAPTATEPLSFWYGRSYCMLGQSRPNPGTVNFVQGCGQFRVSATP